MTNLFPYTLNIIHVYNNFNFNFKSKSNLKGVKSKKKKEIKGTNHNYTLFIVLWTWHDIFRKTTI